MMKEIRNHIQIIIIFFIFIFYAPVKACSSFAVYSTDTLYAMNFDYPQTDIRFSIQNYGGHTFFLTEFASNGGWATLLGMNEEGFMLNAQMVYPGINAVVQQGESGINIINLMNVALNGHNSVSSMQDYLVTANRRFVNDGVYLHSLLADKIGNACVLEVGADSNMITPIQNNFLVMTNFNNHRFWGVPYNEISGVVGAYRYRTAYANILNNFDTFGFEDALETLQLAAQTSGSYETICSFVFDPVELYIYIIINRNFEQIYRISITDNQIETFRGFNYYDSVPIGAGGVQVSELSTVLSINDDQSGLIQNTALHQNYPNPFNPTTVVSYQLSVNSKVELSVYNSLGQKVDVLVSDIQIPGEYSVNWNAGDLAGGVYFYILKTGNQHIKTRKMLLIK